MPVEIIDSLGLRGKMLPIPSDEWSLPVNQRNLTPLTSLPFDFTRELVEER